MAPPIQPPDPARQPGIFLHRAVPVYWLCHPLAVRADHAENTGDVGFEQLQLIRLHDALGITTAGSHAQRSEPSSMHTFPFFATAHQRPLHGTAQSHDTILCLALINSLPGAVPSLSAQRYSQGPGLLWSASPRSNG